MAAVEAAREQYCKQEVVVEATTNGQLEEGIEMRGAQREFATDRVGTILPRSADGRLDEGISPALVPLRIKILQEMSCSREIAGTGGDELRSIGNVTGEGLGGRSERQRM
jgi:hypothetical protein